MNIAEMKRDLVAKKNEIAALSTAQKTAADTEKRERSPEERTALEAKLEEGRALKARIDTAEADERQDAEIGRLTSGMILEQPRTDAPTSEFRSMGQQLIDSPDYTGFIRGKGHRRSGSWTSPMVELQATTLDTSSGSGGTLIAPQRLPGIQPLYFRKPRINDLIAQGTTDSNTIIFLRETTYTNAAAAVLEGGVKPESTLIFAQATAPVLKTAHWLPVTEEMLEDYSAIRSYVDARLRLGLELVRDDELLNGSGVAPHQTGILTTVGLTPAQARGADTNMDAILKEITKIETTAFIQVDGIVLHPTNWMTIQLTKNLNGNYLGSGPWAAPQVPTLWGYPVVSTPTIALGVGLVGAFQTAAQVFQHGGVRVEVSNSHSDFFIRNLIAIRAEERLALCVYRPAAFGTITGLN